MNRGIESTFAEWRFLSLTLLICAYLLAAPLIVGKWQLQMLMEVLLLFTVLVTVSANPGWRNRRRTLVALWLMSVTGSLLSVLSVRPDLWVAPGFVDTWFRAMMPNEVMYGTASI